MTCRLSNFKQVFRTPRISLGYGGVDMGEEMRNKKEQKKIILPKDIQVEMMKFFLRTSIPKKKQLREEQLKHEEEQSRLSNTEDGSDT